MKSLLLSSVLLLTGCASNCTKACLFGIGPGNSAFDKIAKFHDDTDPCQYSGKKQALLYLSVIDLNPGDIKPIVDVEYTKYWNNKKYIKKYIGNLISFISTIKEKTGQDPIIYTNPNFWETYIQKHYHSDHLLWIADYRKRDTPQVPSKFQDWYIWQYTDKGKVNGIDGHVDLNYCKNLDTLLIK
jgi:lysozyme